MEKQTAVEWLYNELSKNNTSTDSVIERINKESSIWEQAKQMEKEYIINANRDGVDMCVKQKPFITGEEYYNKTFKTK